MFYQILQTSCKIPKYIITIRNSSCGKVMFSQACVKNSVHGGGAVHPLGRHPWADIPLYTHPSQAHSPPEHTPKGWLLQRTVNNNNNNNNNNNIFYSIIVHVSCVHLSYGILMPTLWCYLYNN